MGLECKRPLKIILTSVYNGGISHLGLLVCPAYDSNATIRPSVCLSVCSMPRAQQRCILGLQNTNRNPELDDEVRPPKVAETATKPSSAPIQKHSLGNCSIDRALCWLRTCSICTVWSSQTAIYAFRGYLGDTLFQIGIVQQWFSPLQHKPRLSAEVQCILPLEYYVNSGPWITTSNVTDYSTVRENGRVMFWRLIFLAALFTIKRKRLLE